MSHVLVDYIRSLLTRGSDDCSGGYIPPGEEICPFDFCGQKHNAENPLTAEQMHAHARLALAEMDLKGMYTTQLP